jgi:hypothetical protein
MQYIRQVKTPQERDITGWIFGKLTAAWPSANTDKGPTWLCFCNCGRFKFVRMDSLFSGRTGSCNCIGYNTARTHGYVSVGLLSSELQAYRNAKYRCQTPTCHAYKDYGARGIKFLFKDFVEFITEIGPKPSSEYSLDRIDNNGHYEKGNVRWATREEQGTNKRNSRRACAKLR